MAGAILYKIELAENADLPTTSEIARPIVSEKYLSVTAITISGKMYLVGYDPGADEAAISEFTPTSPWLTPLAVKPRLGSGKNIITAFTLGNVPYLVAYSADNGVLDIYSIAGDLSLSKAFHYSRNHEPGITQGFTTLKA